MKVLKTFWFAIVLVVSLVSITNNVWALASRPPDGTSAPDWPVYCNKSCYMIAYTCIAEGKRETGKVGKETGYS